MLEIEVKIRVADLEAVQKNLTARGAQLIKPRHLEENTLYDFREGNLYARNHALRLRTVNKKTFLTYKGAPLKSRKFKIREEFETELKNRADSRKILKALGLIPVVSYSKHRTVYRHRRLKICLDETSAGVFLELEGKRSDIVRFANSIGFEKTEFITADYIRLMKEAESRKRE